MKIILNRVRSNTFNISTYDIRFELRKCVIKPIDFRFIAVSYFHKNVIKL